MDVAETKAESLVKMRPMCHMTLIISMERLVALNYTFRYVLLGTEFRLKIIVISSWVIACYPAILENPSEEFEIIIRIVMNLLVYFDLSLILYCHFSVYFATDSRGGSRIFLRRGCTTEKWRN